MRLLLLLIFAFSLHGQIPADPTDPEHPLWPQIDWRSRTQTYIDPQTGVLIKQLNFPGETLFGVNNPYTFNYSYGPSWTNGTHGADTSGSGASISGSSSPLALALNASFQFSTINLQITCAIAGGATGDDAKGQIAVSRNGTAAYGPWKDFTCPSTMSTTQDVGDSVTPNTTNSAGYMPTWIDANGGQRPIGIVVSPGPQSITIAGAGITTAYPSSSLFGFGDPFKLVNGMVFINNGGGYLPYTVASQQKFNQLTMTSSIGGAGGGPVSISSISAAYPGVVTTATAHGYVSGDTVSMTGLGGYPGTIVWTVNVLSPTTLTLQVAGPTYMDGTSVSGCCGTAVLNVAPAIDVPSLYFVVRKKTTSANTMNFRAQYSVLPEDPFILNEGSGGIEHCPPRAVPDGMYISAISSGGVVTFSQATHGFTIGSNVPITLGGTVSTSVDGNYTANIPDNSHATINSWSTGAWSGDGYMFQPGAKLGYLCWIECAGGESVLHEIFQDGEVRAFGALYFNDGSSNIPVSANIDITKNPYLNYLRVFSQGSGGIYAGAFWTRTRDVGQNQPGYNPPWVTIATGVNAAITAFDPRVTIGLDGAKAAITNGSYFLLKGQYGSQDTTGWTVVLNSSGVPVAADSTDGVRPVRYAGQHGASGGRSDTLIVRSFHGAYNFDQNYNGPWKMTLQSTMSGPPFGDCATLAPGNILTAAPFPATGLHCTLVTVDTTTPTAAIPTSDNQGSLQVGDVIDASVGGVGEYLRVAATVCPSCDSTHFVAQRQFSVDHYGFSTCAATQNPGICSWSHSIGTVFTMPTGSIDYPTSNYSSPFSALAWWDFIADPHGLNALDPAGQGLPTATKYFETGFPTASHFDWKDHIFLNDSGGDIAGSPPMLPSNGNAYGVRLCPSSNQRVGCASVFTMNGNPGFSGLAGAASGNYGDKHPSIMSPDPTFFVNDPVTGLPRFPFIVDFQTTGVISDGASHIATLVAGKTNIYKLSCGSSIEDSCDNKRLPLFVTSGNFVLADVSGPGVVLSDTSSDYYHFCIAAVAGECVASPTPSTIGDRYANIPYAVVHPQNLNFGCFDQRILDVCSWMIGSRQGTFSQTGMQRQDRFGNDSRILTNGFLTTRRSGGNMRTTPDGKWALTGIGTLAKVGDFPPYSSVNRTDFIPLQVPVPARAGATAAVIDYGYDENFYCNTRAEGCVANGSATTATNPYYYLSEAPSGKACTSGCTVQVNAIAGRMVYYRPRYLDGGGATVGVGRVSVIAVP